MRNTKQPQTMTDDEITADFQGMIDDWQAQAAADEKTLYVPITRLEIINLVTWIDVHIRKSAKVAMEQIMDGIQREMEKRKAEVK